MDATAWGAIGGGLSALSEGLTAMELRRLAKEKEKQDRERQKQQDALEKAQLAAQSSAKLRSENFKRVGNKDDLATKRRILTDIAMKRKNEEVTDPITGDVYMRGEGESPLDIAQSAKQRDLELKAQLASQAAETKAAIEQIKQDNLNRRFDGTSGNVQTQEAGKNRRWDSTSGNVQTQETGRDRRWDTVSGNVGAQQAGANARAAMSQEGQDRRKAMGGPTSGRVTDAQAKAATFSGLMEAAESELNKNPWGSKPMGAMTEIAIKGDGGGLVANAAAALARTRMTPEQQRAMQSRFQFTQAALYAFSGQSAPNSEVAKNIAIFFPQSGEDDPTLIEQKKRMRATATMLLAKRKAGLVDGAVPVSPDAVGVGSSGLANLNSLGRP